MFVVGSLRSGSAVRFHRWQVTSRGSPGLRAEPRDNCQDVPVLPAAGLHPHQQQIAKPKLRPLLPVIDAILEADRIVPVKQRHTAKRISERLRDEHGYGEATRW